ncbi:DNA-binding response regulator [Dyadobacter endophyticus]|uniref:DNA-binding response regulator n=1 Tax=Dyadobacter endophyticus TaxID=1749036 RepID=A0ABQ1YD88_9BACT|nr:response regulator transcription factor [Dyadobacter endophyticus]GGH20234.1 DNA-binding response regulator [Dyadobacter endophyticus]
MSIQIIIAEDHPLILAGIQFLLMKHKPEAVITCTSDFDKTIAMLGRRQFELLIMDINLPGGDKVSMLHSVRLRQPDLPVLVCSSYDEQLYAVPFIKAGANGYISKTAINDDFTKAVDQVLSGRTYASPEVMQQVFAKLQGSRDTVEALIDKLSERELDVAQMLVKGQSTKHIGEQLSLSSSSVSIYKSKIFDKLGINNVIELTKYFQVNE